MSEEPGQDPEQAINLQNIATNFMAGLQRQFDLLAYHVAGRNAVTESEYGEQASSENLIPFPQAHSDFERIKTFDHQILIKQTLNDILTISTACMLNCFLFCKLLKLDRKLGTGEVGEIIQREIRAAQHQFTAASLESKFDLFEEEFDIRSELEDTLIGVAALLKAMVEHDGKITNQIIEEFGTIELELKTGKAGGVPGDDWFRALETRQKDFHDGDTIILTDEELQQLIISTAFFFDRLFHAVAGYENGLSAAT